MTKTGAEELGSQIKEEGEEAVPCSVRLVISATTDGPLLAEVQDRPVPSLGRMAPSLFLARIR